jgi:hypothetical protein
MVIIALHNVDGNSLSTVLKREQAAAYSKQPAWKRLRAIRLRSGHGLRYPTTCKYDVVVLDCVDWPGLSQSFEKWDADTCDDCAAAQANTREIMPVLLCSMRYRLQGLIACLMAILKIMTTARWL